MRKKDECALTPPMGWNSWDCYAATVTEAQLWENAEYMSKHLAPFGWQYIVCDIQWSSALAGKVPVDSNVYGEDTYIPFTPLCMDEYSRLIPAPERFPSSATGKGFAPIADKIHAMGLKFGIHIMRGIPRQAAHSRTKLLGTSVTADRIANPFSISRWNPDMYGVLSNVPGAEEYYNSLFELYASWGVDYVKVDDICNTNMWPHAPYSGRAEIEMIRRAIDKAGRPMVLSLSPGPALIEEAWHLEENANMWRITDDFWDTWLLLLDMFRRTELWQLHVKEGNWPDCDMLTLGKIGIGFNKPRLTNFTRDEQVTMMTLWCIFRSPLMMGGVLSELDDWTRSLLTNKEVLEVQQLGVNPRQIARDASHAVWLNTAGDGGINLALFNTADEKRTVACPLSVLGIAEAEVRDLWAGKDLGVCTQDIVAKIEPHGAALFRLRKE